MTMRAGLLSALMLLAPPALAQTVHEFMLDNGMKVLVQEDHRAPVVVSQVWYKVGASYEHDGITGISHVLEHMMFKGTRRHGPGEFSRIIAENGGRENAFTGADYTAYFQLLERSRLPVALELEADRMVNLLLQEAEFDKERKVVMEERRLRTEDRPRALTWEQFNAAAYFNSPYRHPVIGWMVDLEHLTLADLQDWYRRWYTPANATLVVAGDVDPQQVLALARKHFGPLPRRDAAPPKPRVEMPQRGLRRITVKAPARLPYLVMGWQTPVLATASPDWEAYALEVLAGVLAGGESARLPRELVRAQKIAADADAGYDLYSRQDQRFVIDATPANGRTVAEVEAAIRAQIERLKNEPISAAELSRIKAQVVAGDVFERDSVFYQAMRLGRLETVGLGWQRAAEYVPRVKAVTAEQVQAVARKYFTDDRLVVAVLEPLPLDKAGPAPPARGRHH